MTQSSPTLLTTDISEADLAIIKDIYFNSFPESERRPWEQIVSPGAPGEPTLYGIICDGRLIGMATLWHFDRFVYIEHLAVSNTLRNSGCGTAALQRILEIAGDKPVVIEVEPPTGADPMTARRIGFYRRNGFEIIDRGYVQPPYSPGLPEVGLYLMSTAPFPPHAAASTLHSRVYGCGLDKALDDVKEGRVNHYDNTEALFKSLNI